MTFPLSDLMSNRNFLRVMTIFGILLTVIFLILFFGKIGRDERGKGILASASLFSMITLLVVINLYSFNLPFLTQSIEVFASALQILYNTVLMVEVLSTLILRKFR